MGRVLGAVAGIVAWLGWLAVSPALGFPTLALGAMLNRLLVPREDPGSWLGWALLLIGLAFSALLYLAAVHRGRLRPSIASGAAYGAVCWLLAGAVLMPLLGLAVPVPATSTPAGLTPPDPMHGSFMMLHLGVAAPIAALVAWLMFGAMLGATAGWRPSYSVQQLVASRLVRGAAIAVVMLIAIGLVGTRLNLGQTDSSVNASRTVATEPLKALPEGADFFSILELSQTPGATLGPHFHPYTGIAYSLKGVATVTFVDGPTMRVAPDEAGFIVQAHAHRNTDDRLPTAALALLIVAVAVVVCFISLRPAGLEWRLLPVGLVLLIAAGAIGIWNPWSNDWLFISVRSVAGRGSPMPLPTASRLYESPDLGALPPGPYVEKLEEITVVPGVATADLGSAGAAVLFVLDGRVEVQPAGGSSIQIGPRGATLLQPGVSVRVSDVGDHAAHLLKLAVTPASSAS